MARPPFRAPQKDAHRINRDIAAPEVRLVDVNGDALGVFPIEAALDRARASGLDLVEIAGQATPPVCKLLDYGKFKYEAQKRKNEAKKKQKTIDVKEVKFRPGIEEHDFMVKVRNAKRFLEDGNKVKVSMWFRGREMSHQEFGKKVLTRVREELEELGRVEFEPKLEGRQMIMILAPNK